MSYHILANCSGCGACARICPTEAIAGEKKSLHVIDPRRCLECGACGKICPVAAVRDAFGIVCRRVKRSAWEKPRLDEKLCMSCGICIDACPANCLDWSEPVMKKETHAYPLLREEKLCIGCGFCARECPVGAIAMTAPTTVSERGVDD